MARARNIKPGFFMNEVLAEFSFATRLMFIGLWTLADREGRLEDRPKRIKIQLFPLDDGLDIDSMMSDLAKAGFLVRYEVDGVRYCQIANFTKHQTPHHKEAASEFPPPAGQPAITRHAYDVPKRQRESIFARDGHACLKCSSTEALTIDHVVPLSKGGDNSDDNLQTLCHRCNSAKGDATKSYIASNVGSTLGQSQTNVDACSRTDSLIPDSLIPDSRERGSKILTEGSAKTEKPDADASRSPPENKSISSEKSTRTPIPQPFRPTEAAVRLAEKHELDVGTEADLFVAHYESTGDFRADWDACFRKWILRSMQHKADSEKRAQGPPHSQKNTNKSKTFSAFDYSRGGDGYGNKREKGRVFEGQLAAGQLGFQGESSD